MDNTDQTPVTSPEPVVPVPQPVAPAPAPAPVPAAPKNQSWGAFIVIFLILAMIVLGAFYAWGERVSQQQPETTVDATVN